MRIDRCFCLQETRTVTSDNTISYQGQCLQLLPNKLRRSWVKAKVEVHEHFDGRLEVFFQGHWLESRAVSPNALQARLTPDIFCEQKG